jgi:hypothetical protein
MLVSAFQKNNMQSNQGTKAHQDIIKDSFENTLIVTNPNNNRASQSNMTHAGSRSSKNALAMANLSSGINSTNSGGPT